MQKRERLGAGPAIRLAVRMRAKQAYLRRHSAWAVCRHVHTN